MPCAACRDPARCDRAGLCQEFKAAPPDRRTLVTQDQHKLEPCPFCGRAASLHLCGFGTAKATCMDCGSEGAYSPSREEAIAAWNRRAHLQQRPLPVREGTDAGCVVHHLAHPCEACAVESAHEQEARHLHGAIMNLPCRVPFPLKEEPEEARAYQRGYKDARHAAAEMVLAAAAAPSLPVRQEPTGWKLVPVEPTEAMVQAALDCQDADPEDGPAAEVYHTYLSMLASSPSVQNMGEGETGKDGVEGRKP